MDKNVPLVVPEVNPEEIPNNHGIIAYESYRILLCMI